MGIVFKAQHRRMKRFAAIKMIAGREIGTPETCRRFSREVEAVARLNHPNKPASRNVATPPEKD